MSAYLSPIGNEVQTDTGGAPLVGGKIYTYLAGTTTAAATYTTSAGSVPQANPIVLNAQGLPDNPVWLAAGVTMKLVIKDSADVTIRTVDNVLGVNDPSASTAQDQWVSYSGTPTYISATSFSVAGDATATLEVGRRIKTTNSGGVIYSTITASSFGAGITTVTVSNDSGTLDASLSAVSYGLLSYSSKSTPQISSGTAVSGNGLTAIDFTGIPGWVKKIHIGISTLSTSGTSIVCVRIGDSGGIEATSYVGSACNVSNGVSPTTVAGTTEWPVLGAVSAGTTMHGVLTLVLIDAAINLWAFSSVGGFSSSAATFFGGGAKALSARLDRVRLTTAGGADTFDSASAMVNIIYE